MKNNKTIFYNEDLNFEIYNYESFSANFPFHFHNYYTLGLIKKGDRKLFCNNQNLALNQGDILLFNPETPHGCSKLKAQNFNYIGINIPKKTMKDLIFELTNKKELIEFSSNVVKFCDVNFSNVDFSSNFHKIYQNISNNKKSKEELLLLLSILFEKKICSPLNVSKNNKIENICFYLKKNYKNRTTLEELSNLFKISKSTLNRKFIRDKNITPYKFQESIKLNEAKKLLKSGFSIAQTAYFLNFCDQSHFTNSFKRHFGFSPLEIKNKKSGQKMNNKSSKNLPAHISAIITIFIWGTTFVSTKILLEDFLAVEILFLRFIIGFLALFLFCSETLKINDFKKELLFIFAGFFGITLYYLLENIALCFTYATNVGVIMSSAPFLTGILSYFVFKKQHSEKLYSGFFLGFLIAIIGIYLISFKNTKIEINPLGDFLAICASFVWAVYSILIKKISNYGFSTIQVTKRIFFWGIILMLPFLFYFEKISNSNLNFETFLNPVNFLNLLFLGLGASAFCFVSWNYSLKKLGTVKTSIYIYLVPVICAVSSVLILGEKLDIFSISGMILVLFGLILSNFKTRN